MGKDLIKMDRVNAKGQVESVYGRITPVSITPSVSYLSTLQDFNAYVTQGTFSEPIIKECILLSNKLYLMGGVCASVIDIMVTMANTIMEIETDNPELNKIMASFLDLVNYSNPKTMMGARQLREEFYMDLLVNGNCFPYEKWETYKIRGKEYFLPMNIMCLNPLSIEIRSTKDNTGEIVSYYNGQYEHIGTPNINKNAPSKQVIKPTNMHRLTRRGRQYFWWGIPFLSKAFPALASKERIKQLDEVTTQGLISLITIFSLYDEKNGKNADKKAVDAFAEKLSGQSAQARYLTWSGPIKSHVIGPSGEILKFSEKYHENDKDVAESLGCPTFLISGNLQGGTNGADYSVKPFKTNLEDLQAINGDWWKYITRKIATLNNLEVNWIECRYAAVNLDDDAKLVAKVDNARDRGLLSNTSAALRLGFSSRLEEHLVNREREMQEKNPKYQFGTPPPVPFQGDGASNPGASTKQGGGGRPKASDPNSKIKDPVKQQESKTNRKIGIKAQILESAMFLRDGMMTVVNDPERDLEEKLDAPLMMAMQVGNIFHNRVCDELENPQAFLSYAFAEANKLSVDVQQMVVAGNVNEDKVDSKVKSLVNRLYKEFMKNIYKGEDE